MLLETLNIPFTRGRTFHGFRTRRAKCDFAIPNYETPKIIIESKGYEATGSKQTDLPGDILTIIQARPQHMHFFVVTDGQGWLGRRSDLLKLVNLHQERQIDMIYTRARLPDLAEAINAIYQAEYLGSKRER